MLSGMLVATGIERTPQRLLRVHNSVSLFQHKCSTRDKSTQIRLMTFDILTDLPLL